MHTRTYFKSVGGCDICACEIYSLEQTHIHLFKENANILFHKAAPSTKQTRAQLHPHPQNETEPGYYSLAKWYQVIHLYRLSADKIGIYIVETMMSDYSPLHLYFLNKSLWAAWPRR